MEDFVLYGAKIALPNGGNEWQEPVVGKALLISQGKIAAILNEGEIPNYIKSENLGGGIITAGFIDTKVNGGGNAMFDNTPDLTTLREVFAAHKRFGTIGIVPTVLSSNVDKMQAAQTACNQAIDNHEAGILGLHFEGQFIATDGKGIHNPANFRTISDEDIALLSQTKGKVIVTIAPEANDLKYMDALKAAGIIVSAGHSHATYGQVKDWIDRGLSGFTHLFNSMSSILSREPAMVGAALSDNDTISGIIVDGVHVATPNLKIAYNCLGATRLMLVTNAMPVVGGDDSFTLFDNTPFARNVVARAGACFDDNGIIAGSSIDMAKAVRNAVDLMGIPIAHALQMASETPARFLGLEDKIGSLKVGCDASLVHLDDKLLPKRVWLNGSEN